MSGKRRMVIERSITVLALLITDIQMSFDMVGQLELLAEGFGAHIAAVGSNVQVNSVDVVVQE